MANMDINTSYTMRLSLQSIKEYEGFLLKYGTKMLPQIAENIVRRVSEEGIKDNYQSAKTIGVQNNGNTITGGIETTDEKDTYLEFGTGIVGSENPHVSEMLEKAGWKYDVNEHGEKGWIYPKKDGTFGWTKGIPAQKKFYNAMERMEQSFETIATEEFRNAVR